MNVRNNHSLWVFATHGDAKTFSKHVVKRANLNSTDLMFITDGGFLLLQGTTLFKVKLTNLNQKMGIDAVYEANIEETTQDYAHPATDLSHISTTTVNKSNEVILEEFRQALRHILSLLNYDSLQIFTEYNYKKSGVSETTISHLITDKDEKFYSNKKLEILNKNKSNQHDDSTQRLPVSLWLQGSGNGGLELVKEAVAQFATGEILHHPILKSAGRQKTENKTLELSPASASLRSQSLGANVNPITPASAGNYHKLDYQNNIESKNDSMATAIILPSPPAEIGADLDFNPSGSQEIINNNPNSFTWTGNSLPSSV